MERSDSRDARSAVTRLPRQTGLDARTLNALLPSRRSVAAGALILALGICLYAASRSTSLFAVGSIEVEGASPVVAAQVRRALRPLRGEPLVGLEADQVERRLAALPMIAEARYDRAFPHTLRVVVRVERPLAVLRRGAAFWLVSASGRVLKRLPKGARPRLPRIWVPSAIGVAAGASVEGDARRAIRTLAPLLGTRFLQRVSTIRTRNGELTLLLRSGNEVRLGNRYLLRVKLELARRLLPSVPPGERAYLDLTVPKWPVLGSLRLKSKVEA